MRNLDGNKARKKKKEKKIEIKGGIIMRKERYIDIVTILITKSIFLVNQTILTLLTTLYNILALLLN